MGDSRDILEPFWLSDMRALVAKDCAFVNFEHGR